MAYSRFRLLDLFGRMSSLNGPRPVQLNQLTQNGQLLKSMSSPSKYICRTFKETQRLSTLEMHPTTKFDKRLLVWTKFYPSMSEVPNVVTKTQIKKARDLSRIKFSLWMIVAAVIGCICMVISGKRARSRGESVERTQLEWQERMAEKGRQERAAAAAAKDGK